MNYVDDVLCHALQQPQEAAFASFTWSWEAKDQSETQSLSSHFMSWFFHLKPRNWRLSFYLKCRLHHHITTYGHFNITIDFCLVTCKDACLFLVDHLEEFQLMTFLAANTLKQKSDLRSCVSNDIFSMSIVHGWHVGVAVLPLMHLCPVVHLYPVSYSIWLRSSLFKKQHSSLPPW